MFGGIVASQFIAEEEVPRGSKRFNSVVITANDWDEVDYSNPRRDVDLSYCSVKTGVNDMLDYMSIAVSLIIPFVIGPLVVGVFQVSTTWYITAIVISYTPNYK